MKLTVLSGSANPGLAAAVALQAGVELANTAIHRFPDGELDVEIAESVRGHDVYVLQPTSPLFESHLLEMLLILDACKRAGATRLTAIIPYFGYARQDRRTGGRRPVGARLVAEVVATGGADRVAAVDLHSALLEGFFPSPLEHITGLPLIVERLRQGATFGVVVAPDLGAARLADRYASALDLPVAIVHKTRLSGDKVAVRRVTGDVRNLAPLLVDDIISTGGTIEAAVSALRAEGCRDDVTVAATHGLFVGGAIERLAQLQVRRIVVTDSVRIPNASALPIEVVSLAGTLGEVVRRLHEGRSLSGLLAP